MISSKKLLVCLICMCTLASCDWFNNDPSASDGIYLYKTKGDYRYLYKIIMLNDSIIGAGSLWNPNPDVLSTSLDEDSLYNKRHNMENGYVLDIAANEYKDVYLSLTYKDVLLKEIAMDNLGYSLPDDTLKKYILDKDPYLEFYESKSEVEYLYLGDTLKINQIILNGEIDKYFERLK